jgi:soluble lytic murein transglycosylase-like protein
LQFAFLGAAFTIAAAYLVITDKTMSAASPEAADVEVTSALPSSFETSALLRAHEPLLLPKEETSDTFEEEQARWVANFDALVEQHALVERQAKTENSAQDHSSDLMPPQTIKALPVGTPLEEIKRASDAFGLDFSFMKAVAKIESNFNPKQRTGSYIGLFQLSKYEFKRYGSGNITRSA